MKADHNNAGSEPKLYIIYEYECDDDNDVVMLQNRATKNLALLFHSR
jgi:hypothetical protein